MKTLGVWHRTYYNKLAFKTAFQEFRKFFPESPYLIISDTGDDFSEYVDEKTFFIMSKIRLWGTGPNAYFNDNLDQWMEYYGSLKKACEICNTDYIMSMEDDVLIKERFDIIEDFDICGPCVATIPERTQNYIRKNLLDNFGVTEEKKYFYGLSGGAIFNAKKFLENYDKIIDNLKKLHNEYTFNLTEPVSAVADANFVIHFNLLNLNYVCSPWLGKEIIHPFKDYYGK